MSHGFSLLFLLFVNSQTINSNIINGEERLRSRLRRQHDHEDDHLNLLTIVPHGHKFVVKAGRKFRLACVYEGDHLDTLKQLQWSNEHGDKIDGESTASVFTIGLHHGTKKKQQSLVFSSISPRDSGKYTCTAEGKQTKLRETVQIVVVDAIKWRQPELKMGAMLGESLIIDCGASGKPEPDIQITDQSGSPLSEDEFRVAGEEVTIERLDKHHQDTVIRCLAVQDFEEHDTTKVEERQVTIDVWYAPEFADDSTERYAIRGRSAWLRCNVSSSNPPVNHFRFFRGTRPLHGRRYHLHVDLANQSSALQIEEVDEEDFDQYRCEAGNGKATTSHIVTLKESNPPQQLHVSLEEVRPNSIRWKLVEDREESAPSIENIRIEYMRKAKLEHGLLSIESENEVWQKQAIVSNRAKNSDDLYDIEGLLEETEYIFRFAGESEAGLGEWMQLIARTSPIHAALSSSVADPLTGHFILLLFFSLFIVLR